MLAIPKSAAEIDPFLNQLWAVADAASGGDWESVDNVVKIHHTCHLGKGCGDIAYCFDTNCGGENAANNAAFIAAVDPNTIRFLISLLRLYHQ